jgi:hypothetical protein
MEFAVSTESSHSKEAIRSNPRLVRVQSFSKGRVIER